MRVLVACEFSGIVRDAFRARGHHAYSCDLLPTEKPGPHFRVDVLSILNGGWDLMIAHPVCTYLANSGVCWLYKNGQINGERYANMILACEFFNHLLGESLFSKAINIPRIAVENPIQHKHARERIRKQDQVIQPWMFGHAEQKATCLWLKGLPPLQPTNNVRESMLSLPDNKRQRLHYLPPSASRQKERSKTFQGIADAMAEQWGATTAKGGRR